MKRILTIISLLLLVACGGKQPRTRYLPLKNVLVSGRDSLYITIPDQTCTLRIDTGRLHLFVKLRLAKKYPEPLSALPVIFITPLDHNGEPLYITDFEIGKPANDDKASAQRAFFNSAPGDTMTFSFLIYGSKDYNLFDVMHDIGALRVSEIDFLASDEWMDPDKPVWNNGIIEQPHAFLMLVEQEVNKVDSMVTAAGNNPRAMEPALENDMGLYQFMFHRNEKVFHVAQKEHFALLSNRYAKILEKARAVTDPESEME